jgi:SAM-dependent methyltransferase
MTNDDVEPGRPPRFERGQLRAAIEDAFTELALHPSCNFHFISGPPLAERLGYTPTLLHFVPDGALASFAGVGNPFRIGPVIEGETILDVGCGAGTDVLVASMLVGPTGRVIGVDMTPAMVERAQQNVLIARASNVEILWGHAESLPLPDDSVDLVISNGVINLTPNKRDAFRELMRVLRPGGRLHIADVVVDTRVPSTVQDLIHLWTDCIAGATALEDYIPIMEETGFKSVEIVELFDVFAGTQIEPRASKQGARGANIRASVEPLS